MCIFLSLRNTILAMNWTEKNVFKQVCWLVWVTFTVTLLIEKLWCIKINKTFLTTLAPFSLKIRPFKAKTVDLELFVCFTKLFGLWPPSRFSVLFLFLLLYRSWPRSLGVDARYTAAKSELHFGFRNSKQGGKHWIKIVVQSQPLQIEVF